MRLLRFKADAIHGFLQFDVKFNHDLTFLTGINGSGKTSAINAIVALITPDLSRLGGLEFKRLSLTLENDGREHVIEASKLEDVVRITVSGAEDNPFNFRPYIDDPDIPPTRQSEAEIEYYRELFVANSNHVVFRTINNLPTPMFLGLDRRVRFDEEPSRRYRSVGRIRRLGRNIFGLTLARSVDDAADLAETRFRDTLIESGKITERLQRELLLNLLSFSSESRNIYGSLTLPTREDIREIQNARRELDTLAQIVSLPKDAVRDQVLPFLDSLEGFAKVIPPNMDVDAVLQDSRPDTRVLSALINWSSNQVHLRRIGAISTTVARYNKFRATLQEDTTRYLKLLESFLSDSGKKLLFDERGYLHVHIEGLKGERPISSLSSGEAQLFVILTHLVFNASARKNVFIIDEPEISLHVQWQELFVDSLIEANPNIQYIMATHSPSIIGYNIENCVDVSYTPPRRRRKN